MLEMSNHLERYGVKRPEVLIKGRQMKLEDAAKTLRELPLYGHTVNKVDFRWPMLGDLLKMNTDKPIYATALRWKQRKEYICGVQVVMGNGQHSPVFLGKTQHESKMKDCVLNPTIRSVKGTQAGDFPRQVVFFDEDGLVVSSIKTKDVELGPETKLLPGEEVIGVYGHKNTDGNGDFHSIGIIVWIPPKF
jgi:hypothetical protein